MSPPLPTEPLLGRLLVVDDSEAKRYVTVRALKTAGYQVFEAQTGEEALEVIEQERPDLVVLDVKLPGISGLDVARRLRADGELRLLPILHLSATFTTDDAKAVGLESGADAYLVAPVDRRLLVATVGSLLRAARAEQKARAASDQLALVLDSTSDMVWVVDSAWRVVFINPRALAHVPHTREALVGRDLWESFPAMRGTAFEERYREAMRERRPLHFEEYFAPRQGWFEVRAFPTPDGGLGVFFSDVTERKRQSFRLQLLADAGALLSSARQPKALLDGVLQLLVPELGDWAAADLVQEDGQVERVALRHRDPHQLEQARAFLGRHPVRLDDPWGPGRAIRTGRTSFAPVVREDAMRAAVGDELFAELRAFGLHSSIVAPLTARDGKVLGALSLVQGDSQREFVQADVLLVEELARRVALAVEHVLLVERTRRAEERFRTLVGATSQLIWSADAHGRLVAEQPTWGAFTGQSAAEYGGEGWVQALHPDDRARALAAWRRAQLEDTHYQTEYRLRRADGEYVWMRAYAAPVKDAQGRISEWVGMNVDISAAKTAEAIVRERSAFAERLVAIASHDLRNPLTAIQMSAAMLQRGRKDEERLKTGLERILSGALRAGRLINDLLDWTQAEIGGGLAVRPRPAQLGAIVRQAVEELQAAHPGREVRLSLGADCDGTWDPDRLLQALMNLLSNAVSHSAPGTPIDVSVGCEGPRVRIAIHNENLSGPIPPELIGGLFQPFKRGDGASAGNKNLGLGLYIVDQIVRRHGGHIDVHSSQQEGTAFVLHLPRGDTAQP